MPLANFSAVIDVPSDMGQQVSPGFCLSREIGPSCDSNLNMHVWKETYPLSVDPISGKVWTALRTQVRCIQNAVPGMQAVMHSGQKEVLWAYSRHNLRTSKILALHSRAPLSADHGHCV